MDYMWVAVAFGCGFLAKQINLPPLVGYLAAGFGLHAIGIEPDASLDVLADLGITLLLFTIGLKLNIKSLFKTEIWAGAVGHMAVIVLLTVVNSSILAYLGFKYFDALDWSAAMLIGFAVSFSSTVCAVKVLEDRGEVSARHGQVTIGILIIQDIAAVIFVTLATNKTPSLWAFALLALPLVRPLLIRLLNACGHGELLPLAGIFLAITGGELFELVGLKAHLGALVVAVLLSGHNKSAELAKALFSFKDLFLIGFFLSIGFTALPTIDMLTAALIMAVALPLKAALFFIWLTRLKLRSRTSMLTGLSLSNYSEFGLIVCSFSVMHGLLAKEWLVIMALAVAFSFIFSSIVNIKAHSLYAHWRVILKKFESSERLPEDQFSHLGGASILVAGMGRVGTGAYDALQCEVNDKICGIDVDRNRVIHQCKLGRNVIVADAEDPEFWEYSDLDSIRLVLLTMPNHQDIVEAVKQLKDAGFPGKIAGIARYDDERKDLLATGIDVAFNFYENIGAGLAEHSIYLLQQPLK